MIRSVAPAVVVQLIFPGSARTLSNTSFKIGPEGRRRANRDERGADARDRREIIRIVRQLAVKIGMPGERRRGRKKQRVVTRALVKAVRATKPLPPGRFSTTTGWPHWLVSFSAIRRVPTSAPSRHRWGGTISPGASANPARGRVWRYNPSKCRQKQCPNGTGTLHCRHGFFPVSRSCVASRPYPPKKSWPIRHKL